VTRAEPNRKASQDRQHQELHRVVNTYRTPSAAYLMLHRASCSSISGEPARGLTFTGGEYIKVCGGREEAEDFASKLAGQARPCGMCLRDEQSSPGGRAREGGKYGLLRDHLEGEPGSRAYMSFAEIENLAGRLPDSARLHRAWWSNGSGSGTQSRAWREAGWRVDSVDQAAGQVIFARGSTDHARRPAAGQPGPYIDPAVAASLAASAAGLGFDAAKLTRLIGELNDNYSRGNAYAAHALLRALLDHIPPLLGCTDFKAAASSHPWGRTDRSYARKLADFKFQADDALHRQISARTDLLGMDDMPPRVWVNRILQECVG
jgi:hypothetical protein